MRNITQEDLERSILLSNIARKQALLKRALLELRQLINGEVCDHSVGMCYCNTFSVLDSIDEELKNDSYSSGD